MRFRGGRVSFHKLTSGGNDLSGVRRCLLPMLLGGLVVCCHPQSLCAQPGDQENRRELIDRLLRSLIESELNRYDQRDKRPNNRTPAPPRPVAGKNEISRIRETFNNFATEASRLTVALHNSRNRVDGIGSHLSDALRIRARSAILAQQAQRSYDVASVAQEFENVDRDWRLLSYRLRRIRGLDQTIEQHIERLNQYNQTLGDLLKIQPQLNRTELTRESAILAATLGGLTEDIQIEVEDARKRRELLVAASELRQQVQLVSTLVADQATYDQVVEEYKRFQTLWGTFAADLQSYNNRYLERSIRRIRDADRTIHELLWLPQEIDRVQLLQSTEVLVRHVDEFFDRSPLRLLIGLPDSQSVLPTASQFYGVCEHFRDVVQRNESQAELIASFEYIDQSWQDFYELFRHMESEAARQVLSDIEQSVIALQNALQLSGSFNRSEMVELAGKLQNLAEHLEADAQHWLQNERGSFRLSIQRELQGFVQSSKTLHENAVGGTGLRELMEQCVLLSDRWDRVKQSIDQCRTADKHHLQRVAARISPTIVELRTRFAAN